MSQNGELGLTAVDKQPIHGIDLPGYASLMVQLATGQPREAVLSGAGLDEKRWLEVEKTWGLRVAKSAQTGDWDTIREFEKSVAGAQKACPAPDPSRPLQDYAAIVAALESGTTPIAVCAAFGMKLGEFFALQQAWIRRITGDPALASAFREMVHRARQTSVGQKP